MTKEWMLLALLAACGSGKSAPTAPPTPTGPAASTVCAQATFATLSTTGACTAIDATCTFPEGDCSCGPQSYCGGIPPSEETEAELAKPVWQCTPKRTDGCPDVAKGACSEEGRVCTYGSCCIQPVTCTSGTWVAGQASCPP